MDYVVDGMNVIGSRADGWWRDRPAARRRLVADLAPLSAAGDAVTVFFDGRPTASERAGTNDAGVSIRFAPGGRNAADDAIVDHVASLARPGDVVVVTSDAELSRRVRAHGAGVMGAGAFRDRLAVR
jgi:predicted RNA-binding protein with PIN domain